MHELSTIHYVIDTVEKLAVENQLTKIGSVTLEVGEVSGIIPHFLSDYWEYAKKKTTYLQDAELKIETIHAFTYCQIPDQCEQILIRIKDRQMRIFRL